MSYDEKLYQRIVKVLETTNSIEPKNMFGGICFMHRGNMLCGIDGKRLMVRVGPIQYERALSLKNASVMDITGKPMKGFIFVSPSGTSTLSDLRKWVALGLNFTSSLPAKKMKTAKTSKKKRIVISEDDNKDETPISKLVNFGPVTLPEIESLGFHNLRDLRKMGWEDVCRKWVENYPERLNVNAFIGIIATLEGIPWTKITPSQRSSARSLVNHLRREIHKPPVKGPRPKRRKPRR